MPIQIHLTSRIFVTVLFTSFLIFFFTPPVSNAVETEDAKHDNSLSENELPDLDENDFDDIMDSFDDESEEVLITDEPEKSYSLSIEGDVSLHSACSPWNDDERWDGLTRLRTGLFLELNWPLTDFWKFRISGKAFYDFTYHINGRDDYTREVLDEYEKDAELFEAYIMGNPLRSLDVKVGRQIIVWGKSDYIRITDVLNPLDQQIPGLTDIEYLRLPVTMTRVDYYFGNWNLTGIAVHEHRYNKDPEFGSDFYFFPGPEPHEDIPANNLKNTELAAAINGTFSGWDISLYFADIYDDVTYIDWATGRMKHASITMAGISSNVAVGNWLYIGEAAYFSGMDFSLPSGKTFSRTDIMGGIEYSGINDMTLNIEAVNRHVHDYEDALELAPVLVKRNLLQTVLRVSRTFMNETLTLTILASTFGTTGQDGAFQRLTAEYDITDEIEITCAAILYKSGDLTQFQDIGDNDRLYLEIKYSF